MIDRFCAFCIFYSWHLLQSHFGINKVRISSKMFSIKNHKENYSRIFTIDNQPNNKTTILIKLVIKVTVILCIPR